MVWVKCRVSNNPRCCVRAHCLVWIGRVLQAMRRVQEAKPSPTAPTALYVAPLIEQPKAVPAKEPAIVAPLGNPGCTFHTTGPNFVSQVCARSLFGGVPDVFVVWLCASVCLFVCCFSCALVWWFVDGGVVIVHAVLVCSRGTAVSHATTPIRTVKARVSRA